jgi:hypothetical protein
MAGGGSKALIISETGWRGAKEFSSSVLKSGFSVDIVIKGAVKKEVIDIISRPEGLRICAVPRSFFIGYLLLYILWNTITGRLKTVISTKESTRRWLKAVGITAKILVETKEGYSLK